MPESLLVRTERDFLGTMDIPINALYRIHARRASQNFPYSSLFQQSWYKAMGSVKLAVFKAYDVFILNTFQKINCRLFYKPVMKSHKDFTMNISLCHPFLAELALVST